MAIKNKKEIKISVPDNVEHILNILICNGYDACVVGGCVRDSILGRVPNDWDICTNAAPMKILEIFNSENYRTIPTGLQHGTITIVSDGENYEVTTFRIEGNYSDSRHPDKVEFTSSLKEDLKRRDFTINAMAYNNTDGLSDYFEGLKDLNNKIIKCVGDSIERFEEDNLRRLRAIRFASQLGFKIDKDTYEALCFNNHKLHNLSKERIKDELCKMLISDNPSFAIEEMHKTGMLYYVIPELEECVGFDQHNMHHDKDVFKHILQVLQNTAPKLELRLAALFHDIGKPRCFTIGEDGQGHFINHHKIGADISKEVLKRLKFDNKTIEKVSLLVYEHMNRDSRMKNKGIKKLINRVGIENLDDLFRIQIADIKGTAQEYRNYDQVLELEEKCKKIINENQPLLIKDLAINGKDLMNLGIIQGKEVGVILNKLLEIVLESPEMNEREVLLKEAGILIKKP